VRHANLGGYHPTTPAGHKPMAWHSLWTDIVKMSHIAGLVGGIASIRGHRLAGCFLVLYL